MLLLQLLLPPCGAQSGIRRPGQSGEETNAEEKSQVWDVQTEIAKLRGRVKTLMPCHVMIISYHSTDWGKKKLKKRKAGGKGGNFVGCLPQKTREKYGLDLSRIQRRPPKNTPPPGVRYCSLCNLATKWATNGLDRRAMQVGGSLHLI